MIQSILVYGTDGELVFSDEFGSLPLTSAMQRFSASLREMMAGASSGVHSLDVNNLQVSYISDSDFSMIAYSNHTDSAATIADSIRQIWSRVRPSLDSSDSEAIRIPIREILLNHTMKISIFGMHAVGKTTIRQMLLKGTLPLVPKPTIGVEIRHVPEGFLGQSRGIVIWDIGGQFKFQTLWPGYLKGSQLVLLVTDSSLESVLWTRRMLPHVREWSDNSELLVIANKQDLSRALTQERVESTVGIKTQALNALDFDSYQHDRLRARIKESLGLA